LKPYPTYRSIKDHTEALQIEYDPGVLPYETILESIFSRHNPESRCGSLQYRAGVWYHNESQRKALATFVDSLEKRKGIKVKTHMAPLGPFYRAEEYHQKYYEKFAVKVAKRGGGW